MSVSNSAKETFKEKMMTDQLDDQYATAAETAVPMTPDTRSESEKQLDEALDAAGVYEQGVTAEHHQAVTQRVAIAMLDQKALRIAELEAQLESIGAGGVSRLLAPRPQPTVPDNMQDWAGMDGACAFHLIERHADNWGDTAKMMHEWLAANQAKPVASIP